VKADPERPRDASGPGQSAGAGACRRCLRSSWLLGALGVVLDYHGRDVSRLLGALELEDQQLIEATAGRRRAQLRERWERFGPEEMPGGGPDVESICRHRDGWPRTLARRAGAPRMLYVAAGVKRLRALTADPAVAIVGSRRATDYGMEMARSLARGLAASGVTVVSGFADGIATAAHSGALEVDGPTIAAIAGGVDVCRPASRRALYERVRARGCALAELPCGFRERRWCRIACARTVAGLASLTIVVEADEGPCELAEARVAQALGRTVAAVPGRVTSPLSRGTCALLMEGAPLVRGARDALELLYGQHTPPGREPALQEPAKLEPRLRTLLEQVGAGRDTLGKLTVSGADAVETMLALCELELMGLLARGDGGRYVPRESLADS